MTREELMIWGSAALAPIIASLVAGKAIRRVLFMPFEWLSKRTKTELDDQIIADAREDLGIVPTKFDNDNDKEDK